MENLGIAISENYKGDIGIFQLMVHETSDLGIRWTPDRIAELRANGPSKLFCHSVFKVVVGRPFSTVIFRDHYLYVCRQKFDGYIIHLPREMDPQLCIEGIGKLFRSAARILAEERVEPIMVYLEHVPSEYYTQNFAEFGQMVKDAKLPLPVGLCVDTCHLFVSGISLASAKSVREYMEPVITVGLPVIIHLNDSENPLGSFVDRHAELGKLIWKDDRSGLVELMHLSLIKIIELRDCTGSIDFIIKNILAK